MRGKSSAIRRAESFHHSRSLGDFDHLARDSPEPRSIVNIDISSDFSGGYQRDRSRFGSKSAERILNPEQEDKTRRLHKSKSMEFLKAKLLSRKPTSKQQQPPPRAQHNHGPLDPRFLYGGGHPFQQQPLRRDMATSLENVARSAKQNNKPVNGNYDWRQDTPFWNGKPSRTKPAVPAKPAKIKEEPWTHLHGPASMWPGGQQPYPPGLFLGRKAGVPGGGSFYPSFNVSNPKKPGNVSRNIVLPPAPPPAPFAHHHHHPAFAAVAAAAAAHAAAAVAHNNSKSSGVIVTHPATPQPPPNAPVLSDNLRDRLEITELSDGEESELPAIPSPDYQQQAPPSSINSGGRRSSHSTSSSNGKILDMPSGLY